jgi:hypothetical protein
VSVFGRTIDEVQRKLGKEIALLAAAFNSIC